MTATLTPDAFGNAVASTGSTGSSCQFAATSGYRTDGDAWLMKVGARYYDPQVGSFITRDTCLDQKPYLYWEHDPVNAVDPSGHLWQWVTNVLRFFHIIPPPPPPPAPTGPAFPGPVPKVWGGHGNYSYDGPITEDPADPIGESPSGGSSGGGAAGIVTIGIGFGLGAEGAHHIIGHGKKMGWDPATGRMGGLLAGDSEDQPDPPGGYSNGD